MKNIRTYSIDQYKLSNVKQTMGFHKMCGIYNKLNERKISLKKYLNLIDEIRKDNNNSKMDLYDLTIWECEGRKLDAEYISHK